MEEITPREIWIGVAVAVLSFALALMFFPFVQDNWMQSLYQYQSAIVIQTPDQFQYASNTQIGNVLGYGSLTADTPATFPELKNNYAIVYKTQERYTRHSYLVCASYNSKGSCTVWVTRYYYTWDYDGREIHASPYFHFLGIQLAYSELSISPSEQLSLSESTMKTDFLQDATADYLYENSSFWPSVGDLRWYYTYLPTETTGTVFAQFNSQKHGALPYYLNQTPKQVIDQKRNMIHTMSILYFILWTVIPTLVYLVVAYEFLEW